MSCVDHSLRCIDWTILSQQFEGHNVNSPVFDELLEGISHSEYGSAELQRVLVWELTHIQNGFQIFYNCLRDTQDICRGHQILADELEMESRSKIIICVATQFNHIVA